MLASSCTVLTGLADNPGTGAGDSDLGDEYPLSCKATVIAVSCQKTGRKDGGARRDRTDDLLLAKDHRYYQLPRKALILLNYLDHQYKPLSLICKFIGGFE